MKHSLKVWLLIVLKRVILIIINVSWDSYYFSVEYSPNIWVLIVLQRKILIINANFTGTPNYIIYYSSLIFLEYRRIIIASYLYAKMSYID